MIFTGKINIRRTLILLGIYFLGVVTGIPITTKIIFGTLNTESISKALNKPTQTTTTNNSVDVKKLKVKDSDSVTFGFKPITTQEPTQIITSKPCDSIWTKLSNSQKNRLKRWIKD